MSRRREDRPYEPLGMTTLMWQAVPPVRVPVHWLVATNEIVEAALDGPDTSDCGDPFPHVVEHHGRLFVDDGNHRVARARGRGRSHVVVRLLRTYE